MLLVQKDLGFRSFLFLHKYQGSCPRRVTCGPRASLENASPWLPPIHSKPGQATRAVKTPRLSDLVRGTPDCLTLARVTFHAA